LLLLHDLTPPVFERNTAGCTAWSKLARLMDVAVSENVLVKPTVSPGLLFVNLDLALLNVHQVLGLGYFKIEF